MSDGSCVFIIEKSTNLVINITNNGIDYDQDCCYTVIDNSSSNVGIGSMYDPQSNTFSNIELEDIQNIRFNQLLPAYCLARSNAFIYNFGTCQARTLDGTWMLAGWQIIDITSNEIAVNWLILESVCNDLLSVGNLTEMFQIQSKNNIIIFLNTVQAKKLISDLKLEGLKLVQYQWYLKNCILNANTIQEVALIDVYKGWPLSTITLSINFPICLETQ